MSALNYDQDDDDYDDEYNDSDFDFDESDLEDEQIDKSILQEDGDDESEQPKNIINNDEDEDEEDIEDEDDEEDIEEENQDDDEIPYIVTQREERKIIQKYKDENIQNFSVQGMYGLLSAIVNFLKKGGSMIDTRTTFNYPDETEESYAIESIILDTFPFDWVIKEYKIPLRLEVRLTCLKLILRPVDTDKTIFLTKQFRSTFPLFCKNLFNTTITPEEYEEIRNVKRERNLEV